MAWHIDRGPTEFDQLRSFDMDVGWAYYIVRGAEERTVSVIVAGGRLNSEELPEDSREAIRTKGRSAVEAVLSLDEPPRYLAVTSTGIEERDPDDTSG